MDDVLPDVLEDLRDEADVVVLLARMPLAELQQLGEKHRGLIDVAVVGESTRGRGLAFPEHGGAIYLTATNRGQGLGIGMIGTAGGEIDAMTADELILTRKYPEDPEINALVATSA